MVNRPRRQMSSEGHSTPTGINRLMCTKPFFTAITHSISVVKESSIIAVQIFDQRKFKKKDQGFLGVINCRVGDVLDLALGGDG